MSNWFLEFQIMRRKRIQTPITKSMRCKSLTSKYIRCRKMTRRTNQCWIHLLSNNNLRIKRSLIPNAGLGLFAGLKKINKRQSLGYYTGRRIKNKKLDKYYPKTNLAPYAICESGQKNARCINANFSTDAAPRYANDIMSKAKTNMDIRNVGAKKYQPKAFATKEIKPNQEIYYYYGPQYWK